MVWEYHYKLESKLKKPDSHTPWVSIKYNLIYICPSTFSASSFCKPRIKIIYHPHYFSFYFFNNIHFLNSFLWFYNTAIKFPVFNKHFLYNAIIYLFFELLLTILIALFFMFPTFFGFFLFLICLFLVSVIHIYIVSVCILLIPVEHYLRKTGHLV